MTQHNETCDTHTDQAQQAAPKHDIIPHFVPHPAHLHTAIAAAGAWRPAEGDITRVPMMIAHNAKMVDLFHRIHRSATFHHAEDVRKAWKAGPGAALQFIPTDAEMMALPLEVWEEVFVQTPTADTLNQYVSEVNDCDKHAQLFSGLCAAMWYLNGVGQIIDWSGSHSYNAVLVQPAQGEQPEIRIVEPQGSGLVEDHLLHSHPYTLESGVVLMG